MTMFDGFRLEHVDLGEVRIRARHGGSGPPVVLLHGHPRTHTTWHAVAPRLAGRHYVVAPDLRGYGESTLPPDQPGHAQSAKRAMAGDVVRLMAHLGHDRFAVVGHDRGALVAFRAAMDHPEAVTQLVVMDGLPVVEHLERTDARFARAWWHWWFLGQTDKPAERVINADPAAWYRTPGPEAMGPGNHADVWAAYRNPDVVHGMCEDYRAGLGIDREHDEADRVAGRRVACPTLLLESQHDDLDLQGDPAAIWAPWLVRPLRHRIIDSGHHQAEQAPDAVADALLEFFAGQAAQEHADAFNEAVGSGDWSSFAGRFHPEAVMEFAGPPVGPFHGRDAIAAAYAADPPDDTLRIRGVRSSDGIDVVTFEWSRGGTGTMEIRRVDGLVTHLLVRFG